MGFSLKNWLEEATAQVNPFDGGKTASTVRAARPKPAPAKTQGRAVFKNYAQPTTQSAPPKPPTQNTIWNNPLTRGASRVFDQVNMFDNNRTWSNRTPTDNKSITQQVNQRLDTGGRSNIEQLQRIPGAAAQMVTRVPQGLFAGAETVGQGFRRFGNILLPGDPFDERSTRSYVPQLFEGAGKQADWAERKIGESRFGAKEGDNIVGDLSSGVGSLAGFAAMNAASGGTGSTLAMGLNTLGQGTDESVKAGRSIADATVRQLPNAAAQAALEKFGYGKLLKPLGGRATTRLVSRAISEGTQEGLQETAGNISARMDYDPNRGVFDNVAKSAALGAVIGGGVGAPIDFAQNVPKITTNLAPTVKTAMDSTRRAINPVAAQYDTEIANLEQARRNAPTEQAKARYGRAIDALIKERADTLQGGYARIPGGNNDIAPDLSMAQKVFINDYAEMLEGMSNDGGVNILPDGTRVSSNSPFYREVYAEKGRAPTKAEWFEEARRQIESGQAAFGASEDYARINTPQPQAENNIVQPDTQGRTPNQLESPNMAQLPQTSQSQLQENTQQNLQSSEIQQESAKSPSSDNIIQLKTVDVNDPFRNDSLARKFKNEFGRYFVDEDSEMINLFKRIEKETGDKDLVEQWMYDSNLVRGSNSIANSKIRNSQNLLEAFNGLNKKQVKALDEYAAARSELYNARQGMKTSKSVEELSQVVADLDAEYGGRFAALNKHYQELADDLYEAGIIDAAKRDAWKSNTDYVRVQRDLDDLVDQGYGRGKSRSFGSTSTSKKRTGSKRDILSTAETTLKRTQEIQLEIQRNKAASNTIDMLEKYGLADNLVNADDVQFRRDVYKFLSDTKEGKNAVDGLLKKNSKKLNKLQREVDNLNQKGMELRLNQNGKQEVAKAFQYLTKTELRNPKRTSKATMSSVGTPRTITGTASDRLSISGGTNMRSAVKALVSQDPSGLRQVKNMLSSREPALKALIEDVEQLQATSEAFRTARKEAYESALARADSNTKGKNTIKRIRNGITEVYEVPKDIKRVVDNVSPFQLGVVAQIVSAPTRLFRSGTTALSAPFAVTNYARDQISSGIYSDNVLATHNPKTIVSGIYEGVKDFGGGNTSDLWQKFESVAGDQTIFDELRNTKNSKRLLGELRGGAGKKARAKNVINPANTIRNMEDLIGITEQATRFQNFKGIYETTLKETKNEELALRKATQAALQNSVNFRRAGSISRIVNLIIPYFNAGIQGSRNVGRSFRDRPVGTTAKSLAFVAMPAVGALLYNYSDDERRRIYENISETEKENNFIFVLPGASQREDGTYEGVIKVPKPQGYRELTDPVRVVAERFAGGESSKSIAEMAKDMAGAFSGPVQTEDMNKFMASFVPQAVKPILQAHLNKDLYWGSDTVPDYMVEGTDDPTKRAYKGTSGMARFIADQLNVSPITVEKAIIDTAGSLGRYGINAVDNVLANQGLIPEEQIGGRSIKSDFTRRVAEARGIEKENMTDGQRYFKDVKEVTASLKPQQRAAWDSYNQSNKNFLGEELYEKSSFAKKQAKAAAYVQFPELFEIDKQLDMKSRERGETGNPLYDLPYKRALKVVQKKAMLPGASDPELDSLYDRPWYEEFQAKESKFYDEIFGGKEQDTDNPYPKRSKELTNVMNAYYDMDTSQRRAFRNANPQIYEQFKQYYAAKDAWENNERLKIGLGKMPVDDKYGYSGGFRSYSGGSRSYSRGGRSSGGSRGKYDYKFNMFDDTSSVSLSKALRQLLKEATIS